MAYQSTTRARDRERGATAIFLVIFASLLLSVITIGFIRIMLNEQTRSLDNVLSQAAYDSAVAGVEDAKRVIALCQQGNTTACAAVDSQQCDTTHVVTGVTSGETPIQTSVSNGNDMNQAYTCVKVMMNTPDYQAVVTPGQSLVIPLKATKSFSRVKIAWQINGKTGGVVTPFASGPCHSDGGAVTPLCPQTGANGWDNFPAFMVAQFIAPNGGDRLTSFAQLGQSNSGHTLYLKPSTTGLATANESSMQRFTPDQPSSAGQTNAPKLVQCNDAPLQSGYMCSVTVTIDSIDAEAKMAFLRLSPLYRAADVQITLVGGNDPEFDGIQPAVDSTGRANDVYRRVMSRLSFGNPVFPFPQNAVELSGSLCKDFMVIDSGLMGAPACQP